MNTPPLLRPDVGPTAREGRREAFSGLARYGLCQGWAYRLLYAAL